MSMDWTTEDEMFNGLFFCATQAMEGALPHMCRLEQKRLTLIRRWLSQTQAVLGRAILGG